MPSKRNRKHNGGGWSDAGMIVPGYLAHNPYTGPGKDCAGDPTPPGFISRFPSVGLPGLAGGTRRKNRKQRKQRKIRGGTVLGLAHMNAVHDVSPFKNHVVMSAPGVPTPANAQMPSSAQMPAQPPSQKGGRWGSFPELGPLNPINAVGASGMAQFGRIGCEAGTYNPLNPNPNDIQQATTAPLMPPVMKMLGGANGFAPAPYSASDSSNFPQVNVGAADSMRYNAPTAGYRNDFQAFPSGSAVPGLTLQTPYDAKSFNASCIKTGGYLPVAAYAAPVTPLRESQVMSRSIFDGTTGGLPVKFGGYHSRKRARKHKHKRSCKHTKKNSKHSKKHSKNSKKH